jgi:ribosome-associated protein
VIRVTQSVSIDERDISCSYVRAHGPGGQHVNKVSTAVLLRYDPQGIHPLSEELFERLKSAAGSRMGVDGVVQITARRFRSQERNREDAHFRLVELVRKAAARKRARKPTRPTAASRRRRLSDKRKRAETKRLRQGSQAED